MNPSIKLSDVSPVQIDERTLEVVEQIRTVELAINNFLLEPHSNEYLARLKQQIKLRRQVQHKTPNQN